MEIGAAQARALRMSALLLGPAPPPGGPGAERGVGDVTRWLGAMQAQDHNSGLWSLGARLPGWTQADVVAALERREVLRTWPMRGTVHLVPARDARWMLDLMGARPLAGAAKRREFLGLPEATAERAVEVLGDALAGGGRLTRAQCLAVLEDAGISGAGNYGYHLLWYASQHGVICIAPHVDGEQTFVRLDDWVPDPVRLDRDEALATITRRYVASHGPAQLRDLAGWTGLTMADVRAGLASAGDDIVEVRVEGQPMLADARALDAGVSEGAVLDGEVRVLPGFDEYLLGYKDRALMADATVMAAVIPGGNGVFRPTLVRDGRVIATWTRRATSSRVVVEVRPLVRLSARDRRRLPPAWEPYAAFLEMPVEVRWPDA